MLDVTFIANLKARTHYIHPDLICHALYINIESNKLETLYDSRMLSQKHLSPHFSMPLTYLQLC